MKTTMIAAVGMAMTSATIGLAGPAHADPNSFQSPTGNIICVMLLFAGHNTANCQIYDYTYQTPPKPPDCNASWGDNWHLDEGDPNPPYTVCHSGSNALPPIPTLDYGQTRSIGALSCTSEPDGMRCADTSTDHFFHVARESYELG